MPFSDDLYDRILKHPREQDPGIDSLLVVSGYATAAMASYHIEDLQKENREIKTDLIVGMTPRDGILESDHKGFIDLVNKFPNRFSCRYIVGNHPVHSKLYVWCEKEIPKVAFTGSANYTQTALLSRQGELVTDCDPNFGFDYFYSFESATIFCDDPYVGNSTKIYRREVQQRNSTIAQPAEDSSDFPSVDVTLIQRGEQVGKRSGLNWGQRPEEGRDPNQAYIPLRADIYRSDFFPEIGQHFTVITDDNITLTCSRAQQNGKAIHTPLNNSEVGKYFRSRLDVPDGEIVTLEHLERYGRTDVTFFKLDEENYYMDFRRKS